MSLRTQLQIAFAITVFLCVFLTTLSALIANIHQANKFAILETNAWAQDLSMLISEQYTLVEDWDKFDFETIMPEIVEPLESPLLFEPTSSGDISGVEWYEETEPDYPEDAIFVGTKLKILNLNGDILFNKDTSKRKSNPEEKWHKVEGSIININSKQKVGSIEFELSDKYSQEAIFHYVIENLILNVIGGSITLIIILTTVFFVTKKLLKPLISLTKNVERIAKDNNINLNSQENTKNELIRLQGTFDEFCYELKNQKKIRQRLLNDISHEVNTPLTRINLEAKALADGLQTPLKASEQITEDIKKMQGIVQDLQWLAETDSGEVPLNITKFNLLKLIKTELDNWQAFAKEKGVNIIQPPHNHTLDHTVYADKLRISQAFNNLISNAIFYSNSGGDITVFLDSEGVENYVIRVKDNGIGIKEKHIKNIFERFYRVDQSRSKHSGGRGIGLSIVKANIESHAGTVSAYSEGPGKGVEFTITLPKTYHKQQSKNEKI